MGFLDRLFGGGGEKRKEEKPKPESAIAPLLPVEKPKESESIPDYIVSKQSDRTILHIPRSKMDKIGGREVVRGFFREIYGGSDPAWGHDFNTSYAVEFTALPRINVDEAIEQMKRMIDERAKE